MFKQDGQISGLLRMITTPLRAANVHITKPHSRANREYNLIQEIFNDENEKTGMKIPFSSVITTITRMLIDGWAPHELVWRIDEDGFVRVSKIAYRSPLSIRIKINNVGEIIGYTQIKTRPTDLTEKFEIFIPRNKTLHFVFGEEWNPIYGRSLFLPAYFHYEKKHKLYYISHIAEQIRALRLRILKSPEQAETTKVQKVTDAVSKLGFNSTLNLPGGFELDFPDLGSSDNELLSIIRHHDVQMSKAVLAQVIDIGTEDGSTGSFNLSDTHLDIFITNLELISRSVANIINRYVIPNLIDWNFGTGNYPRIEFNPFDREDRKFLSQLFTRIAGARQVNVTPEFQLEVEKRVAEIINADIDYDEISQRSIDKASKMLDLEIEKLDSEVKVNRSNANRTEEGGDNIGDNND